MGHIWRCAHSLVFCCLLLSSMGVQGSGYLKYKDPKQPLNTRIDDLLSRMTLAEKIGQMSQIERSVATPDVITNYYIGSVLSGGGSVPAPQATAQEWASMVTQMQKAALSTCIDLSMVMAMSIKPLSSLHLMYLPRMKQLMLVSIRISFFTLR